MLLVKMNTLNLSTSPAKVSMLSALVYVVSDLLPLQ